MRHQTTNKQESGVNGKWERVPCDWIVNYRRVVMGEVRFEREVNARW